MSYKQFPTDAPTRARISFFVHGWCGFARDPSQHIKTPTWMSTGGLRAKVVPETDYLACFFWSHARVPQAFCQADSVLTRCQVKKPQNPQEQVDRKKRDNEWSAPAHACHTHCTTLHLATTADWSMTFFGTDFKKHAIRQGSVEKRIFVARKVRTINFDEVSRTSWNASRCKERLRRRLAAVFWQATINLICNVGNLFTIPVPGCTALT